MKCLIGVFLLSVLFAAPSCKLVNKLGQFYIDYTDAVTYPSDVPANLPITVYSPDITTNIEQTLQANNTNPKLVKSVQLNQLSLTITSPSGQTFSFLQNVSIYISTDSLPEVEIASAQNIPDTVGAQLNLMVSNTDLKSYVESNTFKLRISGTSNQLLSHSVNINIYTKFFVQANLLAVL